MMAADLNRAAITENGVIAGLVGTIAHGILGLPLNLQGDPELIAALSDADGTTGDYGAMIPESEAAQVFADGITLGVGLGQLIEPHPEKMRPIGDRNVPRLRWWDPRWLRQDPYSRRWFLMTRTGEIEIVPGDGEWILFTPYSEIEPTLNAPWRFLTLSFVFGRDATFDRQRHSEVLSPVRVMRAAKPTTKEAREKNRKLLSKMQRDNYFVLPEQWIYEVVESTGRVADIYAAIIEWAERSAQIGLTGNTVTTEGNKGFSEGKIHYRIARDRLRFYAAAWFRCIREQALTPWAVENFRTRKVPTGGYNVEPPDDFLDRAEANKAWAESIDAMSDAFDRVGVQIDPQWVIEEAQRRGVRTMLKPKGSAPATRLEFTPSDLVNFVTVNEARQSQGLDPIAGGEVTITAYIEKTQAPSVPGVDASALASDPNLRRIARARGWRKLTRKAKP